MSIRTPLLPKNLVDLSGDREKIVQLLRVFYQELSFKDELLAPLYHDQSEPHHDRFASWLFSACGVEKEYDEEEKKKVSAAHMKAKSCPLREAPGSDPRCGKIGQGFTEDQRNRWLKYQYDACQLLSMPRDFTDCYIRELTVLIDGYGPYTKARSDDDDREYMRCNRLQ